MIEVSTTQATERAYQAAHMERALAMRAAWAWLFSPISR